MKMSINSQDKSRLEISRRFLAIISALSRTAFQGKYQNIRVGRDPQGSSCPTLGSSKKSDHEKKKKKKVAG